MFASLASDDWDLVILGDDAQSQTHRARLEALAGSLGVAERVSIMGTVEDVEDYYRRASIFAFPSSSEGFPNALAEAMAHGMSCVSYDCCAGPGDLITEGETGYLVPVFDDAEFADRLERLMSDRGLREEMGRKAKESMKAFAAHRIAQQYAEAILD
jgi:GalNAc-alpha-(1->4)-GalNAc-alpha-(1->3)-diNAcBac-PP-undecaprenol alpha-1,4-N-acetyl-D-galactosaminyltransferase